MSHIESEAGLFPQMLDQSAAQALSLAAGTVFQPRAPVSTRELFAGRWEQVTTVVDAVAQTGLHIVIFGERGVGKTSLASIIDPLLHVMEESFTGQEPEARLVTKVNAADGDSFEILWRRAFDEVYLEDDKPVTLLGPNRIKEMVPLRAALGISDEPSIDEVRRTLATLERSVFIFDEFDRGNPTLRVAFTDLIKALSDYVVKSTIVLVGVSDTIDRLVRDHASIHRSIVQIMLPRMTERELSDILERASKKLGVKFSPEAAALIVRMSQGLPHYTHLIGLHATREAANRLSRSIETVDVHHSFKKAVGQAVQTCREQYLKAIHTARNDALYDKVILACAAASSAATDALGYFHAADVTDPLAVILNRDAVPFGTFQKHITEFCGESRGQILERDGVKRAYKYRFRDPLLPPYIFMQAMTKGMIDQHTLQKLTGG